MSVGLKVCGVTRAQDARLCAELGVTAVGLNFWPGSRRFVSREAARSILRELEGSLVQIVGVFVDASPDEVRDVANELGLSAIQPHGNRPVHDYIDVGVPYVWVLRGAATSLDPLPDPAPRSILVDARVPAFGGQGQLADWAFARTVIRRYASSEVWLAGGIDVDNAARAIREVGPRGLDVASGVEIEGATHGEKDPAKIARIWQICRTTEPLAPATPPVS